MKDVATPANQVEVRGVIKSALENAALVNYERLSEEARIEGKLDTFKKRFWYIFEIGRHHSQNMQISKPHCIFSSASSLTLLQLTVKTNKVKHLAMNKILGIKLKNIMGHSGRSPFPLAKEFRS